ncbi:MAG TPA: hypothetical protein VKE40_18055 [Gemmataceae bacterium]|nr:hypothetical protein [Gemmataceae bacterium]
MSIHVLVEPLPDGSGFRARTGSPLDLTATGPTPESALDEIGRQLAEKWQRGARIYPLPTLPSHRRTDLPPPTDEEMRDFWAAVEEYRDQCDREAEERYGVKIDRPAR